MTAPAECWVCAMKIITSHSQCQTWYTRTHSISGLSLSYASHQYQMKTNDFIMKLKSFSLKSLEYCHYRKLNICRCRTYRVWISTRNENDSVNCQSKHDLFFVQFWCFLTLCRGGRLLSSSMQQSKVKCIRIQWKNRTTNQRFETSRRWKRQHKMTLGKHSVKWRANMIQFAVIAIISCHRLQMANQWNTRRIRMCYDPLAFRCSLLRSVACTVYTIDRNSLFTWNHSNYPLLMA